ncbi:EscU/YscU/HrcU family type III secretion system export apparatus switch protein [Lutispora thermophila]|uniref:Flagellar biosynthesis protein n=1 Tax=Lutispora thermophila DSM 19022 TaxID=1122184 RepID=A0A1M6ANZ1_9FIRM|nr:EscU/YscU/HrcU family type III secretion system export apparatus switch protein [Lutispora thermophila]SHI38210.1 flagellar biosynthesis protein [Lutispora thermophila DSM 19022]
MIYKNFNQIQKRKNSGMMAAAIHYDGGDDAPKVTASGKGRVAAKIIEMAKAKSIPIEEDTSLVAELIDMDLGDNVPPQLYSVIAEILLLIERMESML